MRSSWRPFTAALAATAVLAIGFGALISHAVAARGPAPALRTVSAGTLARAGITLAPADQPPYCGATRLAAAEGWIESTGQAGCPISSAEAIDAATRAEPGTAAEAVLAQVTATGAGPSAVGSSRMAWVVVVHAAPFILPAAGCVPPTATGAACVSRRAPFTPHRAIVVVDGASGMALAAVQLAS